MKNFLEKVQKNGPEGMIRKKNKRGDSIVESTDRPEIPDKGETSDIPGLSSGVEKGETQVAKPQAKSCS